MDKIKVIDSATNDNISPLYMASPGHFEKPLSLPKVNKSAILMKSIEQVSKSDGVRETRYG